MGVVLERDRSCADSLVFTWPSAVPSDAELVCGDSEVAIVCANWQVENEFGPGRHTLRLGQPLLQAAIYFIDTMARAVEFDSGISAVDQLTGQVIPVRFHGSLRVRAGDPTMLCRHVVGVPVHDLEAGVLRSIRASAERILSRVIGKACVEQPISAIVNPATVGEIARRAVEANPVSIAVSGIEFLRFDALVLSLPTGVSAAWQPSGGYSAPGSRGANAGSASSVRTSESGVASGMIGGNDGEPTEKRTGFDDDAPTELAPRGEGAGEAAGELPSRGEAGRGAAVSGEISRGQASGTIEPRARRDTRTTLPPPPAPPPRHKTPPLGSPISAPVPRQTPPGGPVGGVSAPRHAAPTIKHAVLSPDGAASSQSGQLPIPAGAQVLVYGNDGLWHAATVRQYRNGQYEVVVGNASTVAWVPANRVRL